MSKRCGIIAIIGEPNAGKSTLVNRLVGGKVSIVTPKAQTTRVNVRGVCVEKNSQLIFVDTPGIFAAGKPFEKSMVKSAWVSIKDADCVLLLLDAERGLREDPIKIIERLKKFFPSPSTVEGVAKQGIVQPTHPNVPSQDGKKIILALNKIDTVKKPALLALAQKCEAYGIFTQIFMISAKNGDGVNDIKKYLAEEMPEGPFLYPEEQMSDVEMSQLAAEITREKVFFMLGQELPYAIFIEPEAWEEKADSVKISQAILVEREGQKKIVIGKGGAMLKSIGMSSRKELESMLGKRVHLSLFVKIKPDWKEREAKRR